MMTPLNEPQALGPEVLGLAIDMIVPIKTMAKMPSVILVVHADREEFARAVADIYKKRCPIHIAPMPEYMWADLTAWAVISENGEGVYSSEGF